MPVEDLKPALKKVATNMCAGLQNKYNLAINPSSLTERSFSKRPEILQNRTAASM